MCALVILAYAHMVLLLFFTLGSAKSYAFVESDIALAVDFSSQKPVFSFSLSGL